MQLRKVEIRLQCCPPCMVCPLRPFEIKRRNSHNRSFLSDTEMLEFLPDGVEVLLFNGNQIPVLDWNLFGIWDEHPKLEV